MATQPSRCFVDESLVRSILGKSLDAIDDQHFGGRGLRIEFQPELFLNRCEQ